MCCISGLKVVLNIDQDEYTQKFGEEAGVRVLIHSQAKMPFPEDEGIMARTGYVTSVGITQVLTTFLPHSFIYKP